MSLISALRVVGGAALAGAMLLGLAPAASADATRDAQWALEAFNAEKVWQESTGKGVTVATIDTAVNGAHPDLRRNVLPGRDMTSGNPADQEKSVDHGTAMAAIIAGHGHGPDGSAGVKGLAPDAKILPVRIDTDGDDTGTYNGAEFGKALRYAVDQGAKVVNISVTGPSITTAEGEAIAYAAQKDVLVVSGSGNRGSERVGFPARAPGVLAVGAVDQSGNVWADSNHGPELMLTAPGVGIMSTKADGSYATSDGTSNATAYVAAAAALVRAKYPDLTAGQVANRLVKTALVPDGVEAPDTKYGHGMVRPYRALTEDVPAGPAQGPLETPEYMPDPDADKPLEDNKGKEASDAKLAKAFLFVGVGVGVLVVLVLVLVLLLNRRKRNNPPPPPGGWGGGPGAGPAPGGPPPQYAHHPQPGHPQAPPPQQPPGY